MIFLFRFIRNIFLSLVVFLSVFAVVLAMKTGKTPTFESSREVLSRVIPAFDDSCRFPIEYRIGSLDPNFHMPETEFLSALREAEAVWETGLGRDLFVASNRAESEALPVNLVFDNRQARTDSLKEVSSDIESKKASYEELRREYEVAQKEFEREKAMYDTDVKRYEKRLAEYESRVKQYHDRLATYERQVAEWNAEGGAPADEYEELEDERKALKREASDLEEKRDDMSDEKTSLEKKFRSLNILSGKVNTLAGSLNRLASMLNITVDSYNQVFGTREEFTTGLYTRDEAGARIDVFQFYDHADLVLILAHEMGHALGVDHATEISSIMYPSVGEQQSALTDEDRRLFESACPK